MKTKRTLLAMTALSSLCLGVHAHAAELPFTLTADEIGYTGNNGDIEATGHVEIVTQYGAVQADHISYNTKTDQVTAKGNVLMIAEDNVAVYADSLQLAGDLRQGTLNALRIRMKNDGPALTASSAVRKDEAHFALKNVQYTACPTDTVQPWKVRAESVNYNMEKEEVTYKHAWLDVYDVPVLYVPYLSHTTNPSKGKSGFLSPRFGRSTNRGEEVTMAYYLRPNPNRDYTFRARYMSQRGTQFQGEHRFETLQDYGEFHGSIIDDDKTKETRSHLEAIYEHTFKPGQRMGINTTMASDDTYLDDFLGRNPNYLQTTGYFESANRDDYFALSGTHYQDQRIGQNDDLTAQPLGHMKFEKIIPTKRAGENYTLGMDASILYRDTGVNSRRIVSEAGWDKQINTNDGSLINLAANLRGDIYNVDGTNDRTWVGRALPEVSLQWQQPRLSPNGKHMFTPQAKLVVTPKGGNPNEIPNEDSVAYELDKANLFSSNRFAGYDRIESGPRFIYGVDNKWLGKDRTLASVFFGQSFRMYDDSQLPNLGGTRTRLSDWVGSIDLNPWSWLTINNRFRLDNADFTPRRLDSTLLIGQLNKSYMNVTHSYLDGGPEEVNLQAHYDMTETLYAETNMKRDLTGEGRLLQSGVTLGYRHCCYNLTFSVERRGFDNRNVPPSTDYMLNFELLTLGSSTDNDDK